MSRTMSTYENTNESENRNIKKSRKEYLGKKNKKISKWGKKTPVINDTSIDTFELRSPPVENVLHKTETEIIKWES
jgi:hypothetical protein